MNVDYSILPGYMRPGARRYVEQHIKPGGFIYAVLCNNLRQAIVRANDTNIKFMSEWVIWLHDLPKEYWGSKEKVEAWINKFANKSLCVGCRDNFYNKNNPYNIFECWSFKDAEVVFRKKVHINNVPPWNHEPIKTLSCYSAPQFVMVNKDRTC